MSSTNASSSSITTPGGVHLSPSPITSAPNPLLEHKNKTTSALTPSTTGIKSVCSLINTDALKASRMDAKHRKSFRGTSNSLEDVVYNASFACPELNTIRNTFSSFANFAILLSFSSSSSLSFCFALTTTFRTFLLLKALLVFLFFPPLLLFLFLLFLYLL